MSNAHDPNDISAEELAQRQKLQEGLHLCAVNGQSIGGYDYAQVKNLLGSPARPLQLVWRHAHATGTTGAIATTPAAPDGSSGGDASQVSVSAADSSNMPPPPSALSSDWQKWPTDCWCASIPASEMTSNGFVVIPVLVRRRVFEDTGLATLATTSATPVQRRYTDFLRLYKAIELEMQGMGKYQPTLPRRPPPSPPLSSPCTSHCAGDCGWNLAVPVLEGHQWECGVGCHAGVAVDMNELSFPPKEGPSPFASASAKAQKKEARRASLEKFLLLALAACNAAWFASSQEPATNPWQACSAGLSPESRVLVSEFLGIAAA